MNTTSRAILQTVLATDNSLSSIEHDTVQRLISGETTGVMAKEDDITDRLLITQKVAARLISVSRVTIWRMAKEGLLHPVEVVPGTLRYPYRELAVIADRAFPGKNANAAPNREMSAA